MHSDVTSRLSNARRSITSVLLNLDINPKEMQLSTFIEMLDYFIRHPSQYAEVLNVRYKDNVFTKDAADYISDGSNTSGVGLQ